MNADFAQLAEHLQHGREIEFVYCGREYSITNHSGYWYLCDDTEHVRLATLGRFEDKEQLVQQTAAYRLQGMTIQAIFDGMLYDAERLSIL